ncbi:hypothetical protein ACIBCM_09740 [Streptomyces sp. NPDC051018]|uniref:hypothetical protein n=1 Tax=Streptomyces sp. NPDC051018 TaxID=3365639 RepID=UPI003793396E
MSDLDDPVRAGLRSAAGRAAEHAQPIDARTVVAKGRERRRHRLMAATGAGVLCAVVSLASVVLTSGETAPVRPPVPADVPSDPASLSTATPAPKSTSGAGSTGAATPEGGPPLSTAPAPETSPPVPPSLTMPPGPGTTAVPERGPRG